MTKTCWETLVTCKVFVTCMLQVTKDHLHHLLGVSDYYVMYRHRASQFRETSEKVTDWVNDSFRWSCELL